MKSKIVKILSIFFLVLLVGSLGLVCFADDALNGYQSGSNMPNYSRQYTGFGLYAFDIITNPILHADMGVSSPIRFLYQTGTILGYTHSATYLQSNGYVQNTNYLLSNLVDQRVIKSNSIYGTNAIRTTFNNADKITICCKDIVCGTQSAPLSSARWYSNTPNIESITLSCNYVYKAYENGEWIFKDGSVTNYSLPLSMVDSNGNFQILSQSFFQELGHTQVFVKDYALTFDMNNSVAPRLEIDIDTTITDNTFVIRDFFATPSVTMLESIFGWLDDFLTTDLFGNVSIGDILGIIIGISVSVWLLKVFAGG